MISNLLILYTNILNSLLINILFYLFMFLNFFLILIVSNILNIKYINNIKNINNNKYFSSIFLILVLSFSGIPPFLGFSGKFILFINIIYKINYFILVMIILLNFNAIYFYIQNIRFMIKIFKKINYLIQCFKNNLNFKLIKVLIFFIIFNILNIYFISDIYIYNSIISSQMYI
uniref:NADH dehydrogenase subunit 2 n=1 Tax=Ichthyophthirius multifiliis TaxID=5932 RepID=G1FLB8_ICHMU|nr:NADH dehydrogenase subunit 2 [Ichthyophthirius multifiliis]AEL89260.1 NADH dehydrogenase subunit 2 [Ichthyophthirius multifiliis]